jgi:hypothetical protein
MSWRHLVALVVLSFALAVPAPAAGRVLDVYQDLVDLRVRPAPLVPTKVPRALRPIDRTIAVGSSRRRGGYGIRLASTSPEAVIAIEGGGYASMRKARDDLVRRQGFRARKTRVRGHRGLALKGPQGYGLVWRERGTVYWMGTGTPRKISRAGLRATAAGLDRLGGAYVGTGADPDLGTGAVMVTTKRTVTGDVDWSANCTAGTQYAGSVQISLLRLVGNRYSLDLAGRDTGSLQWSGTVSGTVSSGSMTMTLRATGTFNGDTCDTGDVPLSFSPLR